MSQTAWQASTIAGRVRDFTTWQSLLCRCLNFRHATPRYLGDIGCRRRPRSPTCRMGRSLCRRQLVPLIRATKFRASPRADRTRRARGRRHHHHLRPTMRLQVWTDGDCEPAGEADGRTARSQTFTARLTRMACAPQSSEQRALNRVHRSAGESARAPHRVHCNRRSQTRSPRKCEGACGLGRSGMVQGVMQDCSRATKASR